jgi:GntR family transcriptional regulator/MocR family aminotransferase
VQWDFGVPDIRIAPARALGRAYGRVLRRHAATVLAYDRYSDAPEAPLKAELIAMLSMNRSLAIEPDELVLTRGSQMGLYLIARCLIRAGDLVAVEEPGYSPAADLFRRLGARVAPIAVDGAGIQVDALAALHAERPVRAVFVTPHHQFPTTVTLSASRRLALMELCARARIALIEDDFDHEFHYDARPVLPLASVDSARVVLYVGSLSKVVAPGLRLGYVVAPKPFARQMEALRRLIDIQPDLVQAGAVAELFQDGEIPRHLRRARRIYGARRDHLAALLRARLGGVLEFELPAGGLAFWCEVDPPIDVEEWAKRAQALGLVFRTGRRFYLDQRPRPFVRLGFGRLDEREQAQAVARLVRAIPRQRSA